MQNKPSRVGPVALTTTTTTNIANPPTLTGGTGFGETKTYFILKHVRVANTTNGALNFALWLGATGTNAAGKEEIAAGVATAGALNANTGVVVAANGIFDWYGAIRMTTADFLVGGASSTGLTITLEGEIGVDP